MNRLSKTEPLIVLQIDKSTYTACEKALITFNREPTTTELFDLIALINDPMTMRDRFALAAMNGLLTEYAGAYQFEKSAKAAYRIANAMLKERKS
jgi:hypothetical protein